MACVVATPSERPQAEGFQAHTIGVRGGGGILAQSE